MRFDFLGQARVIRVLMGHQQVGDAVRWSAEFGALLTECRPQGRVRQDSCRIERGKRRVGLADQ